MNCEMKIRRSWLLVVQVSDPDPHKFSNFSPSEPDLDPKNVGRVQQQPCRRWKFADPIYLNLAEKCLSLIPIRYSSLWIREHLAMTNLIADRKLPSLRRDEK